MPIKFIKGKEIINFLKDESLVERSKTYPGMDDVVFAFYYKDGDSTSLRDRHFLEENNIKPGFTGKDLVAHLDEGMEFFSKEENRRKGLGFYTKAASEEYRKYKRYHKSRGTWENGGVRFDLALPQSKPLPSAPQAEASAQGGVEMQGDKPEAQVQAGAAVDQPAAEAQVQAEAAVEQLEEDEPEAEEDEPEEDEPEEDEPEEELEDDQRESLRGLFDDPISEADAEEQLVEEADTAAKKQPADEQPVEEGDVLAPSEVGLPAAPPGTTFIKASELIKHIDISPQLLAENPQISLQLEKLKKFPNSYFLLSLSKEGGGKCKLSDNGLNLDSLDDDENFLAFLQKAESSFSSLDKRATNFFTSQPARDLWEAAQSKKDNREKPSPKREREGEMPAGADKSAESAAEGEVEDPKSKKKPAGDADDFVEEVISTTNPPKGFVVQKPAVPPSARSGSMLSYGLYLKNSGKLDSLKKRDTLQAHAAPIDLEKFNDTMSKWLKETTKSAKSEEPDEQYEGVKCEKVNDSFVTTVPVGDDSDEPKQVQTITHTYNERSGCPIITMDNPPSDKTIFLFMESSKEMAPLTLDTACGPQMAVKLYEAAVIHGVKINLAEEDRKKIEADPDLLRRFEQLKTIEGNNDLRKQLLGKIEDETYEFGKSLDGIVPPKQLIARGSGPAAQ